MIVDAVLGMGHGDEGKGKITHHLLKSGEYTHCMRFNGGCNAGHTIFHNGQKHVTHSIPSGVFHGITSIIGSGCVIDVDKLFKEINNLESAGVEVRKNLKIAHNAHIITRESLEEDSTDTRIGTTRTGNGPTYRKKYNRSGVRAEDISKLQPFLINTMEEFHLCNPTILMEGAQGYSLDIDWGDYPYVTSSNCGIAAVLQNGISPRHLRDIWGVSKIYETYVGNKYFQPPKKIFKTIQAIGNEYGATTGRPRQCNWIDIQQLQKAVVANGVNKLVFNKMDILREVGVWKVIEPEYNLIEFDGEDDIKIYLKNIFERKHNIDLFFSDNPQTI
tara:strand:- start:28614 stop:29606 length:993 start_codon:yes stop_codon:yes gene_type:complete